MLHPARSVLVSLTDWEHAWALHVGTQRHEIRSGSGDAPHYDPARMEDNLSASRASACVEIAVAKYKGAYWGGHYWPVDEHDKWKWIPDVEPNIEVRRVREMNNPVAVRRRDAHADRVIVCGWPDPTTAYQDVWLVGEIEATDGWKVGMPSEYDPDGTRLVPQGMLTPYGKLSK